jgi:hypothetical protein
MKSTGYSGTSLEKKLGIREGFVISILHPPPYYFDLFTKLPEGLQIVKGGRKKRNFIHYFAKEQAQLVKDLYDLKNSIEQNGMIWISWPKKSSGVTSDITEDTIRNLGLQHGLVDVKVCAVDAVWSGLKLVIPVKERK